MSDCSKFYCFMLYSSLAAAVGTWSFMPIILTVLALAWIEWAIQSAGG